MANFRLKLKISQKEEWADKTAQDNLLFLWIKNYAQQLIIMNS